MQPVKQSSKPRGCRLYDDAYLTKLMELARACHTRGLFTIIDIHQDLFARHYGGDGAPAWTLPSNPGKARYSSHGWFANYFFSGDLIRALHRFWSNGDGIQNHYHAMLNHVAHQFASVPGVIGYDLMNEPMGRPLSVLFGWFERKTLATFYRRAIAAVRRADPERLIIIEPEPLVGFGHPCFLPDLEEKDLVFGRR